MTEHELAINRDLHALDEAHRLNRISRAEYRLRRRRVLQAAHDNGGVVTARKASAPSGSTTRPRTGHAHATSAGDSDEALTSLLSMRPAIAWKHWLVFAAVVIVLVGVVVWLLLGDG